MTSTAKGPTILYVDDDADDRMLLVEAITEADPQYVVETAENGLAAMDVLQSYSTLPCLVILDLNMPGQDGKEVIKQLKASNHFSKLKIVVFTTSSSPEDKKECASFGVDMITKPLSYKELENIAKILITYCNK